MIALPRHNKLTRLPGTLFSDTKKLKSISLSGNYIDVYSPDLLRGQ